MLAQIFLIAPLSAEAGSFPALLDKVLAAAPVAALLVPRGERGEESYQALLRAVLPVTQRHDCALLADNDPALAKKVGADGVHITGGIKAFREAVQMLKPGMIVGAGSLHSRHDAMTKGEADADYLFFGPLTGSPDPDAADNAAWWSETFEIPAVYSNPEALPANAVTAGCEFVAFSDALWSAPEGPAAALAAIEASLEPQA